MMESTMFLPGHQLQVLGPIVGAVAVDVVNDMTFGDRTVRLFPNKTVFRLPSAPVHDQTVSVAYGTSPSQTCQHGLATFFSHFKGKFAAKTDLPQFFDRFWRVVTPKAVFVAQLCLARLLSIIGVLPHAQQRLSISLSMFWRLRSTFRPSHLGFNYSMNYIWKARGG